MVGSKSRRKRLSVKADLEEYFSPGDAAKIIKQLSGDVRGMRFVIYVRVSSEGQQQNGNLFQQIEIMKSILRSFEAKVVGVVDAVDGGHGMPCFRRAIRIAKDQNAAVPCLCPQR